jgi:VIT1/CCC1 family predicted Fe2+/Mn2+ transporter
LPYLPRPLAWAALLMPVLWTVVCFAVLGFVNPLLQREVDWPWFIVSQFVYGLGVAWVVLGAGERLGLVVAGTLGGVVGGLLMPLPALLWGVFTGHGVWYPLNLLAAMVVPGLGRLPAEELRRFHGEWFGAAVGIHAGFSLGFGFLFGLVLPRLPRIPGPLSWGGLLMPVLWTAVSYGLMGVVNPVLQQRVDWFWFIISQFVFGLAAAFVVLRSAVVSIPPAGAGPGGGTP